MILYVSLYKSIHILLHFFFLIQILDKNKKYALYLKINLKVYLILLGST